MMMKAMEVTLTSNRLAATEHNGYVVLRHLASGSLLSIWPRSTAKPLSADQRKAIQSAGLNDVDYVAIGHMAIPRVDFAAIMDRLLSQPVVQMDRLIEERHDLYLRRAGELDRIEAERERAFERGTGGIPSYESPKYLALTADISSWESAHPEVMAEIKTRKDAATERFLATD